MAAASRVSSASGAHAGERLHKPPGLGRANAFERFQSTQGQKPRRILQGIIFAELAENELEAPANLNGSGCGQGFRQFFLVANSVHKLLCGSFADAEVLVAQIGEARSQGPIVVRLQAVGQKGDRPGPELLKSNNRAIDNPGVGRGEFALQGEALKDFYRTKPAQWAIYCWDKSGMAETRRALLAQQKSYVKNFGERVIGYGHFVSDDGRDPLGTTFFMQLDDRAAADKFIADEPLNRAGVYQRVEIHRWSNSFGKPAADYRRKGLQQFLCTGPKTGTPEFFRQHLHAHESYFASYGDSFIFRGPIRSADGADNIGTALLLELPDRAAADTFWNNEPFAGNGGYQRDARIIRWVFGD